MKKSRSDRRLNYATVPLAQLPKGRKGKHFKLVNDILADLALLPAGSALKVPFSRLKGEKLTNVRSAINRATRSQGLNVTTSTDQSHIYIWKK
jgi:hypothetical protein